MSAPDFASLGVTARLLDALQSLGYEQPTPIQAQSIPLLLEGKNLLGTAQTGTGKTAAFALPLLSRLDPAQRTPQILVLTPTRELAIQVAEAFQGYARFMKDFHVLPIYGGQDMLSQLKALKRGIQVVVGTPGRILDHLRRRSLNLSELRAVVLDEADEMLRMGFIDDVETILAETPATTQRALFSATMPPAIRRIVGNYLGDASEVKIENKTRTVERINQVYLMVNSRHKLDALTRILEVENFDGMIIFVRTKSATVELAERLEARGFAASALNGDLNQQLRERTIDRLKKGTLDILVATDVAARGLDVDRISHVINYDIPYDNESYVHRIGRTGRAGREGKAILFVTDKERRLLRSIESTTRQPITPMSLPTGQQVSDQRIQDFQQRIVKNLNAEGLEKFRDLLRAMAREQDIDIADIAASLAMQAQLERPLFPKLAEIRSPVAAPERKPRPPVREPEVAVGKREPRKRPPAHSDFPELKMERFRIEAGRNQGVQPKDIVGAIANEADIESQYIGRISLHDDYSTVDLPEGMPRDLFEHLKKVRVCQHPMNLRRIDITENVGIPGEGDKPPRRKFTGPEASNRKSARSGPRKRKAESNAGKHPRR